MVQHHPGSLKQSNKKHKGTFGTKRSQKRSFGPGRVEKKSNIKNGSTKIGAEHKSSNRDSRRIRRNQSQQHRLVKNAEIWLEKRLGTKKGPPKIVNIINLNDSSDLPHMLGSLLGPATSTTPLDLSTLSFKDVVYANYAKFHSNMSFHVSPSSDLLNSLDAVRVADVVLFVTSYSADVTELISQDGHLFITALKSLGCPEVMCCVQGLTAAKGKSRAAALKELESYFQSVFARDVRVLDAEDSVIIARSLSTMATREVGWRSSRTYLTADTVEVTPSLSSDGVTNADSQSCTVRLSGFLRGLPLSVHSLGHIPGVGPCRIESVELTNPEGPLRVNRANSASAVSLVADVSRQESLTMFSSSDILMGEQTWPTDAELGAIDETTNDGRNRRNLPKNVPVGMSDYQADWFLDEEGHFDGAAAQGVTHDAAADGDADPSAWHGDEEEDEDMADGFSVIGSMIDSPMAQKALVADKILRRQAVDDQEFPDEMDTPQDVSARVRFARFRALQSFRSSPWHPKENLPQSYSQIFQFEDFQGTQRRVLNDRHQMKAAQNNYELDSKALQKTKGKSMAGKSETATITMADDRKAGDEDDDMADDDDNDEDMNDEDDDDDDDEEDEMLLDETANTKTGANTSVHHLSQHGLGHRDATLPGTDDCILSGQYVTLVLTGVPLLAVQRLTEKCLFTWFSLFEHEMKMSVLNFNIQRIDGSDEPIKSKQEVIFMTGFRTFPVKPIYSEANLNCDKNKLERFLLPNHYSIATVFGPACYQPCPLLAFKRSATTGALELFATGSLGSVNPDRIVLKKVILTGVPIRVKKKFGVVKHLFYDPQDVRWFKPAELVTKHGLRGRIREPVGTHGLFKAHFSGPITQNDTVMLILYKRIFPKFPDSSFEVI